MKTLLFPIILLLLFAACGNPKTEVVEDELGVPDSIEIDDDRSTDLPSEDRKLIRKLEGEYYMLREENGDIYYEEPCNFNTYDVKITESAEGSGYWEIYWLSDWYPINRAEEKNGGIYITVETEAENIFMFLPAENDLLWNFAMMGSKEAPPIVRTAAVDSFEIRPCTDARKIMKDLPTNWYLISNIDGKKVIYEPCEEPPGGITIGEHGESIDFWTGSDPYNVISMTKANNRITIKYNSNFDETVYSIIMHDYYGTVAKFGDGKSKDDFYVSKQAKDSYRIVKEECDYE